MPVFAAHWPAFVPIPGLPMELQQHINSFLMPEILIAAHNNIVVKPSNMVLRGHCAPITALEYTRDGKSFLSASTDGTLRVWTRYTTVQIIRAAVGPIMHAKFTKSEKGIVTLQAAKACLFDVFTGRALKHVYFHDASIVRSPFALFHGRQVAMLSNVHTQQVAVYDLRTGVQQVRHTDFRVDINAMATHNNLIVASSCNRVYVYKFDDPEYVRYLFMGSLNVSAVAVNDTFIVVVVNGQRAQVYNHRYQQLRVIGLPYKVDQLILGRHNIFVGLSDQQVVLLDAQTGAYCRLYV